MAVYTSPVKCSNYDFYGIEIAAKGAARPGEWSTFRKLVSKTNETDFSETPAG
jgi:hypothetical protein